MKKALSLMILILFFAAAAFAQEKSAAKWTRIEFENKNFAVSFPPHFVVDAEKREYGQRYQIFGYQNGVKIHMIVYKDAEARNRVKRLNFAGDYRMTDFTAGGFTGKRVPAEDFSKTYFDTLYLASDEYFYWLHVRAGSKDQAEVKRFLYSINLGGKQLFKPTEPTNYPEETVVLDTLATSPEILEAHKRKSEKTERKITYETDSSQYDESFDEKLSRLPIIVERPYPDRPFEVSLLNRSYKATLKINFLANGQIGDIVVYSNSDKVYTKACVDVARKIKFVPAQIDGKNVDAAMIVVYSIRISSNPR